jgi:protein-tyrosine phosphatase
MMDSTLNHPWRVVQLAKGHNFRDIGGYPAANGRTTKWRHIFRSGYMSRVTDEDITQLHALGIVTICDFRTNSERLHRPTQWHKGTTTDLWARDYDFSTGAIFDMADSALVSAAEMRASMLKLYEELPFDQSGSYREMFQRISSGRVPLLFNCSAGKDRTGVAAALILGLLGVPRDVIEQDYMLTNVAMDGLIAFMEKEPKYSKFITENRDQAMPLLRAEPEYLHASFNAIDEKYGTIEDYVRAELGLTHGDIAAIQAHLLD